MKTYFYYLQFNVVNLINAPHVTERRAAQYHTLQGMFCNFQHCSHSPTELNAGHEEFSHYNLTFHRGAFSKLIPIDF